MTETWQEKGTELTSQLTPDPLKNKEAQRHADATTERLSLRKTGSSQGMV